MWSFLSHREIILHISQVAQDAKWMDHTPSCGAIHYSSRLSLFTSMYDRVYFDHDVVHRHICLQSHQVYTHVCPYLKTLSWDRYWKLPWSVARHFIRHRLVPLSWPTRKETLVKAASTHSFLSRVGYLSDPDRAIEWIERLSHLLPWWLWSGQELTWIIWNPISLQISMRPRLNVWFSGVINETMSKWKHTFRIVNVGSPVRKDWTSMIVHSFQTYFLHSTTLSTWHSSSLIVVIRAGNR